MVYIWVSAYFVRHACHIFQTLLYEHPTEEYPHPYQWWKQGERELWQKLRQTFALPKAHTQSGSDQASFAQEQDPILIPVSAYDSSSGTQLAYWTKTDFSASMSEFTRQQMALIESHPDRPTLEEANITGNEEDLEHVFEEAMEDFSPPGFLCTWCYGFIQYACQCNYTCFCCVQKPGHCHIWISLCFMPLLGTC